jgi:hypothetical protein
MSSASAAYRITDDRGGQIGRYVDTFASLRSSGETVMIDGPCLSACTMVLGLMPANKICVTRQARLGFHAAWRPDENGNQVRSDMGTRFLWAVYPKRVRNWLQRKGGLSRHMVFLQGRELAAMYPTCRGGL